MSAKYDTNLQQNEEELEMVKDQLRDKQELIEQFESHMTALTE